MSDDGQDQIDPDSFQQAVDMMSPQTLPSDFDTDLVGAGGGAGTASLDGTEYEVTVTECGIDPDLVDVDDLPEGHVPPPRDYLGRPVHLVAEVETPEGTLSFEVEYIMGGGKAIETLMVFIGDQFNADREWHGFRTFRPDTAEATTFGNEPTVGAPMITVDNATVTVDGAVREGTLTEPETDEDVSLLMTVTCRGDQVSQ